MDDHFERQALANPDEADAIGPPVPNSPDAELSTWPPMPERMIEHVADTLRRVRLGEPVLDGLAGGGAIQAFEEALCRFVGSGYCVATNSGASALHLALLAAGVGPGDEVLVTSYGWGQILVFLDALDAVPVFCDIEPSSLCADPDSVAERITDRTRAIVVTHHAGYPADIPRIMKEATRAGAVVVEDCASALGASLNGRSVGTLGHMAAFSFGPRKHLPLGEGGALITNGRVWYESAVACGQHPDRVALQVTDPRVGDQHDEFFWPYRMHPLAAAMGTAILSSVPEWKAQRQHNVDLLLSQIARVGGVRAHSPTVGREHAWGNLPLTYTGHDGGDGVGAHREYARLLREQSIPVSAGPVFAPLHCRPRVIQRWGPQASCPISERRCRSEELHLQSMSWVGDMRARLDDIAHGLLLAAKASGRVA